MTVSQSSNKHRLQTIVN